MRILLTGANGFLGSTLHKELRNRGHQVTRAIRKKYACIIHQNSKSEGVFYYDSLDRHTDFKKALKGIEVVVHLAARAHMPTRTDFDMYEDFLEINFHGTKNLAYQASQNGVSRFIFVSSVGVNGKFTPAGYRFTEKDEEKPYNSYTISKLQAEKALRKIALETVMEVVIIRPPLVYGPRVKANFLKLMDLIYTGLPLPFAGIDNVRSFICIDNLTDAICLCVIHPMAGNQTFIVSDHAPLSTPQLLEKISHAMGKRLRLFYCPAVFAKTMTAVLKKNSIYDRIWGSLAVNPEKIQKCLGWKPKITVDEGIQNAVSWYCTKHKHRGI